MPTGYPGRIILNYFCKKCEKPFEVSMCEKTKKFCTPKCYWEDKKGKPSYKKGIKTGKPAWNRGLPAPWAKNSPHLFVKGQLTWNRGLKAGAKGIRFGSAINTWKGGVTPKHVYFRRTLEYKIWRQSVFERDNYTCVWCKQRGGKLRADHIKMFAYYPLLRLELSNGQTLCDPCHDWKTRLDMFIYTKKILPELNIV